MTIDEFRLWLRDPHRRPLVMGVLNVTPDSFSDGAKYLDVSAAVAHGRAMIESGVAVIDVGGESTRPGSQPVEADEQIRRVVPVIRTLADQALISIDTGSARVARAALDAGAHIINDIYGGLHDPDLLPMAAKARVPVILMHMQGQPATMQVNPNYGNVTAEVIAFLKERVRAAISAGVDEEMILVDPGIGFGKTMGHSLTLLRNLKELQTLGCPVLVGTSRKGFIAKITGEKIESGRPFGTAATVAWAVANGADMVRVHDVGAMSQVVRVIEAIQRSGAPDFPPVE
jgi:dihydropteroate synthase